MPKLELLHSLPEYPARVTNRAVTEAAPPKIVWAAQHFLKYF